MNEFNEAMFITKVNNIFVKLYTSIMKQDLSDVLHFISEDLEKYFSNIIEDLKVNNKRQMYDELNVRFTRVVSREIINNKEVINVELTSRYMDYIIDMNTGDLLSGNDTYRIEKVNTLVFEKSLNAKDIDIVRMCPGCGNSISVNTSGTCEYCGSVFNQEDYDYVLTSIKVH